MSIVPVQPDAARACRQPALLHLSYKYRTDFSIQASLTAKSGKTSTPATK